MTHPITPPPELIARWEEDWHHAKVKHVQLEDHIATQAARWGADTELEAVLVELKGMHLPDGYADRLRAARRPKPPSLKEQALMALEDGDLGPGASLTPVEVCIIRRALEALPND